MAGYPAIPTRAAFGPTMVDEEPITDTETELGADAVNLAFWQAAGAGRTAPRAMLIVDGSDGSITYQALAWDADGELADVTSARTSAGLYTVTFATTYENEKEVATSFTPRAALAQVQGGAAWLAAWTAISGQVITVRAKTALDVATDADYVLLVW